MDDLCLPDLWEWKPKAGGDHSATRDSNCAPRLLSLLGCAAEHRAHPARCQTEPRGRTVSHGQLYHPSINLFIGWSIHPSIHLAFHPSVGPSIQLHSSPSMHSLIIHYPSTHPPIHLFMHRSIHTTIPPSIHPSIHWAIHLFFHSSIHPTIGPSTQLSISPSMHTLIILHPTYPPTHPSIYWFIHLSIHPTIILNFSNIFVSLTSTKKWGKKILLAALK